jgi:hypothetical protein
MTHPLPFTFAQISPPEALHGAASPSRAKPGRKACAPVPGLKAAHNPWAAA